MKIKNTLLLILIAVGLFSCEKEKLEPRKNTRLSVAFVQEIDESGALFAANIYEFGSEEVLEYGFEYEPYPLLSVGGGEKVSVMGKPENFFEIKATHSMRVGQKYKVNAYLRTESGKTFSADTYFVSQGSAGFIYEKMEVPELIYYGDTITVFAKNLSVQKNNYKVTVNGIQSPVFEAGDGYFKFKLGGPFKSGFEESAMGLFDFKFDVAGKVFELRHPLKFKDPIFNETPKFFLNFSERINISGELLHSPATRIFQRNDINSSNSFIELFPILILNDSISFVPESEIYFEGTSFQAEIRGKRYSLPVSFEYKATEIYSGQKILHSMNSSLTINGVNFNSKNPGIHEIFMDDKLVAKGDFVGFNENKETLSFNISLSGTVNKRKSTFKIRTLGKFSEETIDAELIDPNLPFQFSSIPTIELSNYLSYGAGNSYANHGWLTGKDKIFKMDVGLRTLTMVNSIPGASKNLAYNFSVLDQGKMYIGGGHDIITNQSTKDFFVYDLNSNSMRKLPDLPVPIWKPQLVHIWNGSLYIERGFALIPETGPYSTKDRFKFDLKSEKWIELSPYQNGIDYSDKPIAFDFKGEHYSLGYLEEPGGLFRFNVIDESWERIMDLPFNSISNEIHIIGEEIFVIGGGMWKLNPITKEYIRVNNVNIICNWETVSFQANGKIFVYNCGDLFYEYDPAYFTY